MHQTIRIHPEAPTKPLLGATCNGCGVCCASAPCPAGIVVSGRRHGACRALHWQDAGPQGPARYWCGLLVDPARYTGIRWAGINRWLVAVARRSISAGSGCDAAVEVVPTSGPDR